MGAPVLQTTNVGFPAQFSSKIENIYSNPQGDSVNITCAGGETLIAVVIGLKDADPFDLLHNTTSSPGYLLGVNDYNQTPTISDGSADSVAVTTVTQTDTALTLSAVASSVAGSAVYTGTITGGAANALAGYFFTIAGFVAHTSNNGYFLCTASSATTLTLSNAGAIAETQAATATNYVVAITTASNNFAVGDNVNLAGFTTLTWLNGQTTAVVTTGSVFTVNDLSKHAAQAATPQAAATASRTSGNDWALVSAATLSQFGSDYTVSQTPPVAPNPYPSVRWNLDGYFPCIYVWVANNVSAGTYNVTMNNMFQAGLSPNWVTGRPIMDQGVIFQVIKFTGMTAAALDGGIVSTASSIANPAVTQSALTTTGTGDLVFAVGLQRSANGLSTGPNDGTLSTQYSRISNGKVIGSEAHYVIEWGIQTAAGAWTPSFANPLGYETLISAIAIKHS